MKWSYSTRTTLVSSHEIPKTYPGALRRGSSSRKTRPGLYNISLYLVLSIQIKLNFESWTYELRIWQREFLHIYRVQFVVDTAFSSESNGEPRPG